MTTTLDPFVSLPKDVESHLLVWDITWWTVCLIGGCRLPRCGPIIRDSHECVVEGTVVVGGLASSWVVLVVPCTFE